MKIRSAIAAANIGFMFLVVGGTPAEAAEIKVMAASAIKEVLEDLGTKFERATGHKIAFTFAPIGGVVKRLEGGETADVVIINPQGIDGFIKDGKASAGNVTVIARSYIGVAVRKGAPKPDISSPEAFKRALLGAKSIAYPNPASGSAGGVHFARVLDQLGIANEMKRKTVFSAPPVFVGDMVTNGDAELGVQQLHELMPVAGIEIVGPLPGDLQSPIVFAAVIMGGTKQTDTSKALVNFLRTPDAAALIRAKGLEPATP